MMMKRTSVCACSLVALLLAGCGLGISPDAYPTDQEAVNRIRTDASLTAQEKRDALAALGIDQLTINLILRDNRTANQFGGTLRTALDKVTGGTLSQLTPDEIQIYGDATAAATFTDDQAAAILKFFQDFRIDTADDLETTLDDPATEVPTSVNKDNVRAVFVTFDSSRLIPQLPL